MKDYQISSFKSAMSGPHLRNSLIVMGVVGTVLNLINQGDVLTGTSRLEIPKLILTYLMPFLVVSFGTWSALCQAAKEAAEMRDRDTP